jgi:hypothetical protein
MINANFTEDVKVNAKVDVFGVDQAKTDRQVISNPVRQ